MSSNATELAAQLRIETDKAVAALRYLADAIEALDAKPHMVEVPYRSQWDDDAGLSRVDCGPACIAMMLGWNGTQIAVNDITKLTGTGPTNSKKLWDAALMYGLGLMRVNNAILPGIEQSIDVGHPLIALVRYIAFGTHRQDIDYIGLHWVVVVGHDADHVYIHDPNYWGERRHEGASKAIPRIMFDTAWHDTMPEAVNGQMLVIQPLVVPG